MARRSRMSILKRQREVKRAEKAAKKRAKRLGIPIEVAAEPRPTVRIGDLVEGTDTEDEGTVEDAETEEHALPKDD